MATKVLALNEKGQLTYCTVPPEERGKGRCNHQLHQNPGESNEEFVERVNEVSDYSERFFRDVKQGEVVFEQYKMTDEEKQHLVMVMGRKDLEKDIEGGYIELAEPLWNDMDKNTYSQKFGVPVKDIDAVLHREKFIITDIDEGLGLRLKEGDIITPETHEKLLEKYGDRIKYDTGVVAMNNLAAKNGFEATRDVYVLPYYMRQDPPDGEAKNPINVLYNYLIVKRKDPDIQQNAYEALLNNSKARKPLTQKGGHPIQSLADKFKGKSGVMRAHMSGRRIVNSGRAVITPTMDMEYGEAKIPASMAAKIFEDTIRDRMRQDGHSPVEIDEFLGRFRGVNQEDISQKDRDRLEGIIREAGVKVIINRQPSLHFSSLLSFKPRVSEDATIKMHPMNLPGYNADFDGDTATVYGINDPYIANVAKDLDPSEEYGIRMPRAQDELIAKPTKESLWGLYNILSKRSD